MKRALLYIILFFLFSVSAEATEKKPFNSNIYRSLTDPTNEIHNLEHLKDICFLYLNKADFENALLYAEELRKRGEEEDKPYYVMNSHICLGQAYLMRDEQQKAFNNLSQALKLCDEIKNDSAYCSIYNGFGLYAANVERDYYRSLTWFYKGIESAKKCNYQKLYSILVANIAGVCYLKKDPVGLQYALETYQLGHEAEDPFLIYSGASSAANLYFLTGKYEEALKYIQEAEFLMQQNNFYEQAYILSTYANILAALDRDEEAVSYFQAALTYRATSHTSSYVDACLGYARLLMKKGEYLQALPFLEEGLTCSLENSHPIYRNELYEAISICYEKMNDPDRALTYYKIYKSEEDSLYNADKERAMYDISIKYETEKKENEANLIRLELLKKERKLQLVWVGGTFLLFVITILYYLYYRKNTLYLTIVKQNQEAVRREKRLNERLKEYQHTEQPQAEKYALSSLSNEKSQTLFSDLEEKMFKDKIYKDNLLTKEKVAEMVGTNRTYLSQIINEQTGQTFTQYVNGYRIKEAIHILSDTENDVPLKALCADVGFNSMTTFYNLFNSTVGMTPSQYRHTVVQLQKET